MALEPERVPDSQPYQKLANLQIEELKANHVNELEAEREFAEGQAKLERHVKLMLVVAACFIVIYVGVGWYDRHEQVARELEIVPPPPTAITGSSLLDIEKTSRSSVHAGSESSQRVSLQPIN